MTTEFGYIEIREYYKNRGTSDVYFVDGEIWIGTINVNITHDTNAVVREKLRDLFGRNN